MATGSLIINNKPAPYTFSVKAVGDANTERFVSYAGGVLTFIQSPSLKSYVLSVTDADNKTHVFSFSLDCTPTLGNCAKGPFLTKVQNASRNGAELVFDADGAEQITWRAYQGANLITEGVISPTWYVWPITFTSPLLDGDYLMEIEGKSCKSGKSTQPFTIADANAPLAWMTGYPKWSQSGSVNAIILGVTKTVSCPTFIKNETTGQVYYNNTQQDYTGGSLKMLVDSGYPPGTYTIKVCDLTATLQIGEALPNCDNGPFLEEFISMSRTQAEVKFNANNVTPLRWRIQKSGVDVIDSVITPTNNHPIFTFPSLVDGNYVFGLKGSACFSEWSEKPFVISSGALTLENVFVELVDGRYRLAVIYTGGTGPYQIAVTNSSGGLLYLVTGQSGNPIYVTMPADTVSQMVNVQIKDVNNATDYEPNILLPAGNGSVSPCAVFMTDASSTYSYDPSSGVKTLRITSSGANFISDVANTQNKIWLLDVLSPSGLKIHEYDITLSPFTQVFTRAYTLAGFAPASGLCAGNDSTVYIVGKDIIKVTLSGATATPVTLFTLPDNFGCTGDAIFDPDTNRFVITYDKGLVYKIGVFTAAGVLLRSADIPSNIYGVYQHNGASFMVRNSGQIYAIDLNTLVYSEVGTTGMNIVGATQSPACIDIP